MSNFSSSIEVVDNPEYGVVLRCTDLELADQLEDFLTEECFVLFQIKLEQKEASFYFGQAGSIERVSELCRDFLGSRNEKRNKVMFNSKSGV